MSDKAKRNARFNFEFPFSGKNIKFSIFIPKINLQNQEKMNNCLIIWLKMSKIFPVKIVVK